MTTPSGRLAYGQAGVYDAVDDRGVIAAVTRNREGLTEAARVTAGAGLTVVVAGGWLGVARCGDGTSAVVASRLDHVVDVNPGPPTGTRADVVWCDVAPDEGTWELATYPESATAGRPGIPLAHIVVPANATTAAQMTITPAEGMLERRFIGYEARDDTRTFTQTTWGGAATICTAYNCLIEPGQYYRVQFSATSPASLTGTLETRIGVGARVAGAPDTTSDLLRADAIAYARQNIPQGARVEYVFQHPPGAAPVRRDYVGRVWSVGAGSYRVQLVTGQGPGLLLSVEDAGS